MTMNGGAEGKQDRMAETIRKVLKHRERAPRSPRMERALKRLIWRYNQAIQEVARQERLDERSNGGADG